MTYGFNGPANVTLDAGGASAAMAEERVYTAKGGDSWVIPKGFRTDFATIPTLLSWAVAKLGLWTIAAIVHDLFCEGLNEWHRTRKERESTRHVSGPISECPRCIADQRRPTASSVDADAIFRQICLDHGADRVTANLLWTGVRWGALFSAARRPGFMQTFWPWLGLSLAFAIPFLIATPFVLIGRGLLALARIVVRLIRR